MVVCDAVVGNVMIKFFEGLSTFIFDLLREEFRRPPRGPLAYALMKPGIDRIRDVFDYERFGGSPLLGVKGTVIITHGRAKRRMVGYAVGVGAAAARARIPELIAETFQREPVRAADVAAAAAVAGAGLDEVDRRPVRRARRAATGADERPPPADRRRGRGRAVIRFAAMEVPGVVRVDRGGPVLAPALRPPSIRVRVEDRRVTVRLAVVARPGHPLAPSAGRSAPPSPRRSSASSGSRSARSSSSSTASAPEGGRAARGRAAATPRGSAAPGGAWPSLSVFEAEFGQRTAGTILERHLAESEGDPDAAAFARELVAAVVAHRDTIDARIEEVAPRYPVVQLARIDRALLRCAVGEVLHSATTPARVAIAEWVELARTYSGDPMRRLVNGVLGAHRKGGGHRAGRPAVRSAED